METKVTCGTPGAPSFARSRWWGLGAAPRVDRLAPLRSGVHIAGADGAAPDLERCGPEARGRVTSPLTVDGTKGFECWCSWAFVGDTQLEARFWVFMYRSYVRAGCSTLCKTKNRPAAPVQGSL
jgi:hypothetical protein